MVQFLLSSRQSICHFFYTMLYFFAEFQPKYFNQCFYFCSETAYQKKTKLLNLENLESFCYVSRILNLFFYFSNYINTMSVFFLKISSIISKTKVKVEKHTGAKCVLFKITIMKILEQSVHK